MEYTANCACTARDHNVHIQYFPEDKDAIIETVLNHYLPFWKRVAVGLKYIFGMDNTYNTHVETVIDKDAIIELHDYLSKVVADLNTVK